MVGKHRQDGVLRNLQAGVLLCIGLLMGCSASSDAGGNVSGDLATADNVSQDEHAPAGHFVCQQAETLLLGAEDNAEAIRLVPASTMALLLSSKARKLTLLDTAGGKLSVLRERVLFENDPTESELTNLAVSPDGMWAVCTRTFIKTDESGAQTDCAGELVFVDAGDGASFGDVTHQVEVGPMPDAVAISDDGKWVASANERDGPDAWGKCEVAGEIPSVSIIAMGADGSAPVEAHRMAVVDAGTGPREPESLVFSSDNDLLVVSLQDSHEVLFVRISDLQGAGSEPTSTSVKATIVRLPDDAVGAGPWPDGVGRFQTMDGTELFVTAGEWNDTFTILNSNGGVVSNTAISPSDIPEALPRVLSEGSPRFSPDSVATFLYEGRPHVAFTLRHSGAVAVYDLSDPAAPAFASAVGVGKEETGQWDKEGSSVRPEGIAAAPDGEFLVTANEGESSVSLVLPAEQ